MDVVYSLNVIGKYVVDGVIIGIVVYIFILYARS